MGNFAHVMTDIKDIKNIVFDLGGVVIDLARDHAVASLEHLGLASAGELLDPYVQRGPFLDLETGHITAGEFYDCLRQMITAAGRPAPADVEIQNAFNDFLVALPAERLSRLRALREAGYGVYALSNTNPVMYHSWIAREFTQQGLHINDYFDGIVTSFQEGCCKPDHTIFRRVLTRYSLEASQTLMLDDAPANVEAARQVGMPAIRVGYTPADDMLAITAPLLR